MTILCEPGRDAADALAAVIAGQPGIVGQPRIVAGLSAAAESLAADPEETVLVIGAGVDLEQALPFAAWLRAESPAVGVILLCAELDFRMLARAAGAGVREVLAASDGPGIGQACLRWQQPAEVEAARQPRPPGRVVTVLAAKGGCGKTTLVTNLAVVLSAGGTRRVCLVDLDLSYGDLAGVLRLEAGRSLIDAVEMDRRIDVAGASALVTPFRPGLDCVLAPTGPGEAERVPAELVGQLLEVLRTMYDHIVVDTPAQLTPHVLAALDASDHQVLVTTPEIPTLRNLRRTLDMLDLLSYNRQARSIVFNRCDLRTELMLADVEEAVRTPVAARIPVSADVPASVNRGVPLAAAQPDHPVSRAVARLAEARLTVTGHPPRASRHG